MGWQTSVAPEDRQANVGQLQGVRFQEWGLQPRGRGPTTEGLHQEAGLASQVYSMDQVGMPGKGSPAGTHPGCPQ